MIKYDKERITDLAYVRELLEGKYIKAENKNIYIFFIKKVKDFYTDFTNGNTRIILDCFCMENKFYYTGYKSYYKKISIKKDDVLILKSILKKYSFTTKEEFMNSCNKVMEKIQKGVEKNE